MPFEIREINGSSDEEIQWVAVKMKETLLEVLDEDTAKKMYSG